MILTWCWGLTFVLLNRLCSRQNTPSTDEKAKGQRVTRQERWEADLCLEVQEPESHIHSCLSEASNSQQATSGLQGHRGTPRDTSPVQVRARAA